MKKYILFFLLFNKMFANMPENEGFERFPNHYFVETGTHEGGGVKLALRAGFNEIHSIEIVKTLVEKTREIFSSNKNVHIYEGDSSKILFDIIKDFDKPITFWLDGHGSHKNSKNCPILEELELLKNHPIKTHTILIDDMRCCGTLDFDYITKEAIIKKILEINPKYIIKFIPGFAGWHYVQDDIMLAMAS